MRACACACACACALYVHEDKQRIVIEDAATKQQQTIASGEVAQRREAGTIMPPGLTSRLTREELRDLIRFLAERKGQPLGQMEVPNE